MSKYNRKILIEKIRFQMGKKGIKQQQLGEAIGMSQPNISKALSIKDKKNFTVEQIMDIADLFHISVDSLLGRKGEVSGTLTPRSIARFLVQLIEDNDAEIFDYEKEEETFEYDDNQYPPSVDHEKKVIKYPALYLPNYWYIPYDADPIKEQELYSEMTQVGNETSMIPVNNFLRHFREIFTIYKKGDLSEEAYKSVVEDMLSRLRD